MKTFQVPTRAEVAPANQAIFDQLEKAIGFVPNLYATIGHSSTGLKRFLDYQNAKTSFSNKQKEAINLVVSQENGCLYCQAAHSVFGKMNGFSEGDLMDIRRGHSSDPKLNALVALAADLTRNRGKASDANVDAFFQQGFTNENLVDLILQISDKTAMNYLHNLTQIPVDFPAAPVLES